jgi:hypothetical protein
MRRLRTSIAVLACAACLSACGDGGGSEPARPLTTDDPAAAFAPLVQLHPREDTFPMGAGFFLAHSGLEWIDGECPGELNVTISALPPPGVTGPPLVPARLGAVPGYTARGLRDDCDRPRPEVYSTAMRTRPFDTEDRPRGLQPDEGFTLDVAGDVEKGRRRVAPDGSLAGVPAYFAFEAAEVRGKAGLRISYWLLYGRGERRDPERPGATVIHEGDWERLDVVLQRAGRKRYRPLAVRFHSDGGTRTVPWDEVERSGPGASHPVAYAGRRTHTLRPAGDCDGGCTRWRTWDRLRDAREEPWFGYGGGWGSVGFTSVGSGPLGPSPYELSAAPVDRCGARVGRNAISLPGVGSGLPRRVPFGACQGQSGVARSASGWSTSP